MYFNILLFALLPLLDCDMNQIRKDYDTTDSKAGLEAFLTTYENSECKEYTPYVASAIMQKAAYAPMPNKKLKYFNEGKKMLENYINANPKDVEARYVRVLVQENIPGFLGYKGDIDSDKEFIKNNLATTGFSPEFKDIIEKNLNL